MKTARQEQIEKLRQQLANLEEQEAQDRKKQLVSDVALLTSGWSYEQMCEFREVLNERIRDKYASDAIDDE